jgi:hypothetical protein
VNQTSHITRRAHVSGRGCRVPPAIVARRRRDGSGSWSAKSRSLRWSTPAWPSDHRFRPNIVVRLLRSDPFREDDWVGGVLSSLYGILRPKRRTHQSPATTSSADLRERNDDQRSSCRQAAQKRRSLVEQSRKGSPSPSRIGLEPLPWCWIFPAIRSVSTPASYDTPKHTSRSGDRSYRAHRTRRGRSTAGRGRTGACAHAPSGDCKLACRRRGRIGRSQRARITSTPHFLA